MFDYFWKPEALWAVAPPPGIFWIFQQTAMNIDFEVGWAGMVGVFVNMVLFNDPLKAHFWSPGGPKAPKNFLSIFLWVRKSYALIWYITKDIL